MEYDWRKDSYGSWLLAISELRKRGLREGRFQPVDDDEREYLASLQNKQQESTT